MAFDLDLLVAAYPFLYHLTAAKNMARVWRRRQLQSAATLMQLANSLDLWLETRRPAHVPLDIGGEQVLLRNQAPLHACNVRFEGGWNLPRLVLQLNSRMFFWPGARTAQSRTASGTATDTQSRDRRSCGSRCGICLTLIPAGYRCSARATRDRLGR